ncbi:hypothetical protein BJ138DRAFT_1120699 [Hygrophoropsis aurantiaca]|uniref:Uncharacterized protein n=1 Tax=Hygrophoropsis aurantiaca TaxID=72124 RepID=A0ACB7ZPM6_9AGAM|nr:hypothetical protein BJ138DRAFT_1120699 [Hygrophoropsis aurantiaca]
MAADLMIRISAHHVFHNPPSQSKSISYTHRSQHNPFLTKQPLPIQPSKSRSAKKCTELLASFDTLASHLHTTFTALSTARARAHSIATRASTHADEKAVYLAIVLGPSVGTAKSRTMIGITKHGQASTIASNVTS